MILGITVVGFVLRLAYFWFAQRNAYVCPPEQLLGCAGDGYVYHTSANLLADGRGFISPLGLLSGNVFPSADHPPFYIVYLAGFSKLGLDSYRWHQFATVVLGTFSIPVAGAIGVLLGRTLAGPGPAGHRRLAVARRPHRRAPWRSRRRCGSTTACCCRRARSCSPCCWPRWRPSRSGARPPPVGRC